MLATSGCATLDDLYAVEGKAELVQGRMIRLLPTGDLPSDVANEIYVALRAYAKSTGKGVAKADGVGYTVPELPSGRESFSPDASYYEGPRPANRMRFLEGPPTFAVEVRSENNYGPAAEVELAEKRADYFAAGTQVVWEVDPLAETITVYRATFPDQPTVYSVGNVAEAEPAVPGWRLAVRDAFEV